VTTPPTRWTVGLAGVLVLALAACSGETPLNLQYENRRLFEPPAELYSRWWSEVASCLGRGRDFEGIRWFLADEIRILHGDPSGVMPVGVSHPRGQWNSDREITIAEGYQENHRVVKHEMLHDLLEGDRDHVDPAWGLCDARDGPPGDPTLPTGTFDYRVFFTRDFQEWGFRGTMTITEATDRKVTVVWDVESVSSELNARFRERPSKADWDYDAWVINGDITGGADGYFQHRIVLEEGRVRCVIARFGARSSAPCLLEGPR